MKKIFLYLWQLPQILLAWIMILINTIIYGKPEKETYKGVNYRWFEKWRNGISLGQYVLLGGVYRREDIVKHEYGHTCQSRRQGWLYLIITGAPSGLGNLYHRYARKKHNWTREESARIYYTQPWEVKADEYGETCWQEHV